MVNWKLICKNVDPKDIEEYGRFSEVPAGDHIIKGIVISSKSGNAYNILVSMNTPKLTSKSEVKLFCNCDDFKFRWAWVLNEHNALLSPQNFVLTPPKIMNKTHDLGCCKHIKVFLTLKEKQMLSTLQ